MSVSPGDLHIVHRDSARGTLARALGLNPAAIYREQDDLSFGRLVPIGSVDEWRKVRTEHWNAIHDDPRYGSLESLYSRLLADADVVRSAKHVRLWLGTTVAEQLILAWIVAFFDHYALDLSPIRVIDIPEMDFASGERFAAPSIAVLNPEQVALITTWRKLEPDLLEALRSLWVAVTLSSPSGLTRLLSRSLPETVSHTLESCLLRYPDAENGLNKWERRLLEACRDHGPRAVCAIGHVLVDSHSDRDWIGDSWLFARMKKLGSQYLGVLLLKLSGDLRAVRTTSVELTDAGEDVLAGRVNHVEMNGIDEWVGGVHLSSNNGTVWYRRGEGDGTELVEA